MTATLEYAVNGTQSEAKAEVDSPARIAARRRVLILSTTAFTLLFAVWLMFGILAKPISAELGLTDIQFSWLIAVAILSGSIWRLAFGIYTDRFGGRILMTALLLGSAIPAALIAFAHSFNQLMVLAFFVGFAGNGFAIGIAWNSAWFPKRSQGFALGIFGAGNVGASLTKFLAPPLLAIIPAAGFSVLGITIPGGWRIIPLIYAALLVIMAAAVFFLAPKNDLTPGRGRTLGQQLKPLNSIRVWRFSLYYVVVFGAYVALSAWLPKYYMEVFNVSLPVAGLLTAIFIFPASLLRPLGGYLSDKFGARRVMYCVFTIMTLASLVLALPAFNITLDANGGSFHFHLGITGFTIAIFLLGAGMGVGKAAVYKYIPEYFPNDVGAVGGLVGLLGALGGFFLPPLFALAKSSSNLPQMTFVVILAITVISFLWLHITVLRITRKAAPQIQNQFELKPTT
jgi:NNP family nitrate/nitrite transporter-like MFS transporter